MFILWILNAWRTGTNEKPNYKKLSFNFFNSIHDRNRTNVYNLKEARQ